MGKHRRAVVADHSPNGTEIVSALQHEGWMVHLVRQHSVTGVQLADLVILKGEEPNALEVLNQLRNTPHLRDIPVVVVGIPDGANAEIRAALTLGADALLPRPVRPEKLMERVDLLCPAPDESTSISTHTSRPPAGASTVGIAKRQVGKLQSFYPDTRPPSSLPAPAWGTHRDPVLPSVEEPAVWDTSSDPLSFESNHRAVESPFDEPRAEDSSPALDVPVQDSIATDARPERTMQLQVEDPSVGFMEAAGNQGGNYQGGHTGEVMLRDVGVGESQGFAPPRSTSGALRDRRTPDISKGLQDMFHNASTRLFPEGSVQRYQLPTAPTAAAELVPDELLEAVFLPLDDTPDPLDAFTPHGTGTPHGTPHGSYAPQQDSLRAPTHRAPTTRTPAAEAPAARTPAAEAPAAQTGAGENGALVPESKAAPPKRLDTPPESVTPPSAAVTGTPLVTSAKQKPSAPAALSSPAPKPPEANQELIKESFALALDGDYFRVLGASPGDTFAHIHDAYRQRAQQLRTLQGTADSDPELEVQRLQALEAIEEAWEVLQDDRLRRKYQTALAS